ncbi:PIN domain-like protein [Lentinula edodes]|uniref:PIN domain-like protein n=1 Tax=Lentinula edodes TaxID=5353 RepID=UPI001E8D8BBA|nr:PIN domain-like protein [Lentinula edodes]KAH7872080.1 PIN domain-like protein [Lentinula edodes]
MGIQNLWPLVDEAGFTCKLKNFVMEHGFIKDHHRSRTVIIGVDISSFLDGFRASDRGSHANRRLHASDSTLTQFFKLLCGLSKAGAHCIFVYDGDGRPLIKRGIRVVARESDYYTHSRKLIKYFGYYSHTVNVSIQSTRIMLTSQTQAPGEAEAELSDMYKRGIIDIVLSKDSDVFPLGVGSIMKLIVPKEPRNLWGDLDARVYHAESTGYSQGGFILIALLLQNDFGSGVDGIGHQTARGLAQSGFGDDLLNAYQLFLNSPQQLSEAFRKLNSDMAYEIQYNEQGKMGLCSPFRADILRDSQFPTLEDVNVMNAFLKPLTSSSPGLNPAPVSLSLPTLPDVTGISEFCAEHFAWSPMLALKRFHTHLWPGIVIRMLSSKYIGYNTQKAEFLVPRLQSQPETNSMGNYYIPTLSTTVMNHKALNLQAKHVDESIPITFDTAFFVQLTGLPPSTVQCTRRVDVPVPMLAVATNQTGKVDHLSELLGSRPNSDISVRIQHRNDLGLSNEASSSSQVSISTRKHKHTPAFVTDESSKYSQSGIKYLGVIELSDSEDDELDDLVCT